MTSCSLTLNSSSDPTSAAALGTYNVGRVANTMSYSASSKAAAAAACNPFTSPMETKVRYCLVYVTMETKVRYCLVYVTMETKLRCSIVYVCAHLFADLM